MTKPKIKPEVKVDKKPEAKKPIPKMEKPITHGKNVMWCLFKKGSNNVIPIGTEFGMVAGFCVKNDLKYAADDQLQSNKWLEMRKIEF